MLKHLTAALLFFFSLKTIAQNTPQLVIPTLDRFSIDGINFIPAKKYMVSNGSDNNLKFWQLSDGRMVKNLAVDEMLKPAFKLPLRPMEKRWLLSQFIMLGGSISTILR